jgi:hypothetical protein
VKISPYFHDLRSAYQAELDDLTSDTEGKDVLRKRLAEKRNEIAFLAQMVELAPEMVAVVFHRGFRFIKPSVIEHLLHLPLNEIPDWHSLSHAVTLEPWAQSLAQAVLGEPQGARFMAVAAGLEYLQLHAHMAPGHHGADAEADHDGADAPEHDDDFSALSADDAVDPHNSHTREEASANWLADVGFERKE